MSKFRSHNNAGPWKFSPQKDKFAYINNPRWTPQMAHEDDHEPCGYWYKQWSPEVYLKPGLLPIWEPSSMCLDSEQRKLYTTCCRNYVGGKQVRKIFESDVTNFRHIRTWGKSGTSPEEFGVVIGPASVEPNFHDVFDNASIWWRRDHGDGYYVPISVGRDFSATSRRIDLLNGRTGNITHYNLGPIGNNTTYVDDVDAITMHGNPEVGRPGIAQTRVDLASGRLYVILVSANHYMRNVVYGYFNLESFDWHLIRWEHNQQGAVWLQGMSGGGNADFFLDHTRNLLVITMPSRTVEHWPGFVRVISLSSGALVNYWHASNNANFPSRGIGPSAYGDGYLYGRTYWRGNPDHSGMAIMNISTGAVRYSKPSYAPDSNEYGLSDFCYGANKKVYVNHSGYGIGEYDPATDRWRLLNDWTLPGMHPFFYAVHFGIFSFGITYDDITKCVYSGHGYTLYNRGGWMSGLQDLHWMPTGNWRLWIARHSVVARPPEMDHGDKMPDRIDIKVPMIWTMPNTK
jgi:hypothetical protein